MIVIDDGSADDSVRVIEAALRNAAQPSRIRFVARENRGLATTLREGLEMAGGRYFAVLDADDYWYPEKLKRQHEALSRSLRPAVFADCDVVDASGEKFDRLGRIRPYRGGNIHLDVVLSRFIPPTATSMIEREALISVGGIHAERFVFDFDVWVRFSRDHEVLYVDEPLAGYRVHPGNSSRVYGEKNALSILQTLEDAMEREPALRPLRRTMASRVHAGLAGAMFARLDLRRARAAALRAITLWPFDWTPWRILAGSLLGKDVVERVRSWKASRRRALMSGGVGEGGPA